MEVDVMEDEDIADELIQLAERQQRLLDELERRKQCQESNDNLARSLFGWVSDESRCVLDSGK